MCLLNTGCLLNSGGHQDRFHCLPVPEIHLMENVIFLNLKFILNLILCLRFQGDLQ